MPKVANKPKRDQTPHGCWSCNPEIGMQTDLPGICPACGFVWIDGHYLAEGWGSAIHLLMIGERSGEVFREALGGSAEDFAEFVEMLDGFAFVIAPDQFVSLRWDDWEEAFKESRINVRGEREVMQ